MLDLSRSGRWLAPALALAAMVWLLAPSVAWFDSGELAAAAVQLGVPHPTGLPAFVLSGRVLAELPLASAALRVHLLGALCTVGAVVLWRRALGRSGPRQPFEIVCEILACLLPLGMPALALHVRAAEVYAPTWLIVAAALWAWQAGGAARPAWLGLLAGLGAAVHVEAALIPVLLLLAALWRQPRAWALSVGMGALGALTIAYLPLAAWRQPAFSWGDVRTLPALWDHLSAASIRQAFAGKMGASTGGPQALAHLLWRDGRWLLLPALLAVGQGNRRMWSSLAVIAIDAAYSALVNPMGLRDDQAGLVALLGVSVLAVDGLQTLLDQRVVMRWLVPVAALLFVVVGLTARGHAWGQTDLRAGGRTADLLLRRAVPGQVLMTSTDHAASACVWLQTAEGVRPDATCVPGVFLRDDRMTAHVVRTTGQNGLIAALGQPAGAGRARAWLDRQPIATAWEPGLAAEDAAVADQLLPGWPWSVVHGPTADMRQAALALPDAVTQACTELAETPDCARARTLAAAWSAGLAVHASQWARRDVQVATVLAETAVRLFPAPKALQNLAVLTVDRDPARALQLAELALDREPDYLRAHRPAARAACRLGQRDVAFAHARQALATMGSEAERQQWLAGLAEVAPAEWRAALLGLVP